MAREKKPTRAEQIEEMLDDVEHLIELSEETGDMTYLLVANLCFGIALRANSCCEITGLDKL